MKTIAGGSVLYGMVDLATTVGMPYQRIYARVARGSLEPPQVPHGRGSYYSQEAFERLVSILKEEIKEADGRQNRRVV